MTVTSLVAPVITLSPGTVLANSGGNQASATAGFATYAWTITNDVITSATNLPAITYVAGPSNRVGLGLVASLGPGCSASASVSAPVITGFSIHTNVTFIDGLGETTTGIAFDGTNYWTCSGGCTVGPRLARYSLTGALLGTYSPGLDFRCVFTRPGGTLLAREYNSGIIYRQPVGQSAFDLSDRCDLRLRLVTFRGTNRDGEGDYYDGLASTLPFACAASDDLSRPMGDPAEDSTEEALHWHGSGACSSVIAGVPAAQKPGIQVESRYPVPDHPTPAQVHLPGLY